MKTIAYNKLSVSPPSLYIIGIRMSVRQRVTSEAIINRLLFDRSTTAPANKLKTIFGTRIAMAKYDMAVAVPAKEKTNQLSAAVRITSPSRLMTCPTKRASNFLFARTTE